MTSYDPDVLDAYIELNEPVLISFYQIYNETLIKIEDLVLSMSGKPLDKVGLPAPRRDRRLLVQDKLWREETSYDPDVLDAYIELNEPLLVDGQRLAYETITQSVDSGAGGFIFVDAAGGTGKTFMLNLCLAKMRRARKVALAVASSAVASTLLRGGRTAHSVFKIPIKVAEMDVPICDINKGSNVSELLQQAELVIWDECTMSHRKAFEAVDRSLRDVRGNDSLFGGVTFVVSGDFRQTLPVVKGGTAAEQVGASISKSDLWVHKQRYTLSTNMRALNTGDPAAGDFADLLLRVGDGSLTDEDGNVRIVPGLGRLVSSPAALKMAIYPDLHNRYTNIDWLKERAILCSKNDSVNEVNNELLELLPVEPRVYLSVDKALDDHDGTHFPPEYLNSIEMSGLPQHELVLKVGAPVMLIRNICPPLLCNGTRLQVKKLFDSVIQATIMCGDNAGQDVFIPMLPIIPTDCEVDFQRLQFPLKLCFAITINKSQGQTLGCCGLHFGQGCFSHGQAYVAFSRVGSPDMLYVFAPNGRTRNVVFQGALQY